MSTGVEIIPIFIAVSVIGSLIRAVTEGTVRTTIYAADRLAEKNYPKEKLKLGEEHPDYLKFDEPVKSEEEEIEQGDAWFNENLRLDKTRVKQETVMNDEGLLLATIEDFGLKHTIEEGVVKAVGKDFSVVFEKNKDGVYEAEFSGLAADAAGGAAAQLNEIYAGKVQQRVYENIMARAKNNGLALETEEAGEDNSIVLTFVVEENG